MKSMLTSASMTGSDSAQTAVRDRLAVVTTVTPDYLPWARVLADSLFEYHQDARVVVVVTEPITDAMRCPRDRFELISAYDIGISEVEYEWMRAIYPAAPLCWALKPSALLHMLEDHESVLYLDSDMLVCGELRDLAELAREHGLVLTPHSLKPPPQDGLYPNDEIFLQFGQFNAGFVGVGRTRRDFLEFWGGKLRRDCRAVNEKNPFRAGDQRWLDLAIGYFAPHVLRDQGVNVGHWNLTTNAVGRTTSGLTIDGTPLRLMHFSGFRPQKPDRMTDYPHWPVRPAMTTDPILELCAHYADRLKVAGWTPQRGAVREIAGIALTREIQWALRAALVESERVGAAPDSGPKDPEALLRWLRTPVGVGSVSWYLWGLHQSQPNIAEAFPDINGTDQAAYLCWAATEGVRRDLVPPVLAEPAPESAPFAQVA